jgi:23S rRNA pseudouridine1911/1915/1917 synthase
MHTAPLQRESSAKENLLDWAGERYPEILEVPGRMAREGGLLHRLDYETHGLVLIARTEKAWKNLAAQQEAGCFIKEYLAFSADPAGCGQRSFPSGSALPGFPPFPGEFFPPAEPGASGGKFRIESAFRSYGPGAKQVRPLLSGPKKQLYVTQGIPMAGISGGDCSGCGGYFSIRLVRGFRHQIRCHLAWAGRPLLNDPLYGGKGDGGFLALRAWALEFTDPGTGKRERYVLPWGICYNEVCYEGYEG